MNSQLSVTLCLALSILILSMRLDYKSKIDNLNKRIDFIESMVNVKE